MNLLPIVLRKRKQMIPFTNLFKIFDQLFIDTEFAKFHVDPQEQPPKKSEYSCPNHPPPKWVKASNGEVPEGLATGALQGGVDHSGMSE